VAEWTRSDVRNMTKDIIARDITIAGIAEAAGVSESLVRQVMSGRIRPSFEIRLALAQAFSLDVNQIK
jgi:transcriptional regulator with XRE-family HTH domain